MNRLTLATVAALAASACTSLEAVSTASGQLVSASSSWDAVSDEFAASCHRRNLVSDPRSDCAAEANATAGLEAADKILGAYFSALQQASDSKTFTVEAGIKDLGASVAKVPSISEPQVQAVSGLAAFLGNLVTGALRERTLRRLIDGGGPKAISAIDTLDAVVVPQLGNILARESTQTKAAFTSFILAEGAAFDAATACADDASGKKQSKGGPFLLTLEYCKRMQVIEQKQAALKDYQGSLQKAKATLTDLVNGKDKLSAVETIKALYADAKALNDDLQKIKKAF